MKNTIRIGPHAFLKIEDDVELTDRSEVFVQNLDVSVDDLQRPELVVRLVHGETEEEAGVALVHDAHVFVLDKVAHLLFPLEYHSRQLPDDFLLVLAVPRLVPLLEPQLPLSAEQENEVDHSVCSANTTYSFNICSVYKQNTKFVRQGFILFQLNHYFHKAAYNSSPLSSPSCLPPASPTFHLVVLSADVLVTRHIE